MWLDEVESGALEQALNLAQLPFAFSHIAIMPDAHQGYGMPIGGVLATKGVIIPNAVGVDIGCGMCAVKTDVTALDKKALQKTVNDLRKVVPLGFDHHKNPQSRDLMPVVKGKLEVVEREYKSALTQLGTLGGGNHFIEIQRGNDGFLWMMIHSGSRNIGYKVADHYNKVAKKEKKKFESTIPPSWQLDFLPLDSEEGQNYRKEMNYCVDFALANRKLMMERFKEVFAENCGNKNVSFSPLINIAHNYAAMETHFDNPVVIHRKGATSARKDEAGIIPGSQGAKSYIVKGLGNPESFFSCSHGAGRKMGRKEAVRKLKFDDELYKLEKQGIVHSLFRKKDLEEAAGAYKDISVVMDNQKDLVKIEVELSPLAVLKA